MTREEYMTKLQKYLRKLPKQDYEDAIEYFNEYFSDTDEEGQQRLMDELGTPKEAAADLMYNLLDRKIQEQDESGEEKKSKKGITLLAVYHVNTCDCSTFYRNACSASGGSNLCCLCDLQ